MIEKRGHIRRERRDVRAKKFGGIEENDGGGQGRKEFEKGGRVHGVSLNAKA
jgi:hypothetical protein